MTHEFSAILDYVPPVQPCTARLAIQDFVKRISLSQRHIVDTLYRNDVLHSTTKTGMQVIPVSADAETWNLHIDEEKRVMHSFAPVFRYRASKLQFLSYVLQNSFEKDLADGVCNNLSQINADVGSSTLNLSTESGVIVFTWDTKMDDKALASALMFAPRGLNHTDKTLVEAYTPNQDQVVSFLAKIFGSYFI